MTLINEWSKKKPEFSIVIVSYNTKKITDECIDSVYKSLKYEEANSESIAYEVIVVDNASTDASIEMLKKWQKEKSNFHFIQNKENLGFAKANNLGAVKAKGEYLLFLNSDIVVLNDAIAKLLYFFKQNTDLFNFLGGKLLNKDKSSQPSCGPFYSLYVIFTALFLKGDRWGLTRYSPNQIKKVDWVSGACILTKKEYFQRLGGFDDKIFMYMDEIDLLYRAKQQGFKVYFYPDARFIHLGSASSAARTYPILQVYRGFLYLYKKHFPGQVFFLKIMLQLKAILGIIIGRIIKNQYLVETYEQAYQITKLA